MNNPNPLVPQGSLLQPGSKTKSKVALVIFGVIAIHAALIVGLLVQGCKREEAKKAEPTPISSLPGLPPDPYANKYMEPTNPPPTPSNAPVVTAPAPVAAPEGAAPAPIAAPMTPGVPEGGTHEYTIAKGDSFYSIAKKRGLSMSAVAKANPGVDPARLQVGQKIQLPAAAAAPTAATATAAPEAANGSAGYSVKAGDTLSKIARKHGTTVQALRSANKLKTDRIYVGQKLAVPAAKTAEAPAAEAPAASPTSSALPATPPATSAIPTTPSATPKP